MLIGVVSDTHGYVDPRLRTALAGVEAIVHAGDVCGEHVIEELQAIAPLHAVRGNNDDKVGGLGLPERLDIEIDGVKLHVVHQLKDALPPAGTGIVIFGHSHRPLTEWRDGVLYLNPGAAGRSGFHALQTMALLSIQDGALEPALVELGPRQKSGLRMRR